MRRFFTSDLHLGHRNVIEYCNRPYKDIYEMNEAIITQWNNQVKPEDEVYFLGDFGINKKMALKKEIVSRLNGKKYIILGNHDLGFGRFHQGRNIESFQNKYKDAGWDHVHVVGSLILKNGQHVMLTHLPPDNGYDSRYSQYKLKNCPAMIYLHGHLHGHYQKKNNMIDVAFDSNLVLLSEQDVIDLIDDKRDFIPTRLTTKYTKEVPLMLMPFEAEIKTGYLRKSEDDDLVLYNYTDKCTYDRHWNDVTRYARGLIFERDTGKIVAIPFPKFFNIGEMVETKLENLPDESYVVTEKMDGSLGIVYNYKGQWRVATRGSLNSEQAIKGQEILQKYDMSEVPDELTLLVEIIYPENKIVVNYGDEEKLVLLSAINRETQTEVNQYTKSLIIRDTGMPLVNEYTYSIDDMIELQKTIPKDEEGFVIRFESGLRVKIKGHEYLRIHKILSHMSPISFWESMKEGKVVVDYLEELPEEYRAEADELTTKLETKYRHLKVDIYEATANMLNVIGLGDMGDHEYKKKVGLYVQKKPPHSGAMFPIMLNNFKAIDRYIMRKIRPTGNVM